MTSPNRKSARTAEHVSTAKKPLLRCGIIMPISANIECTAEHWHDVKNIIVDAIESSATPPFKARIVSESDDVGVIQTHIVENLYNSEIIVCDVSCKNPNVMFELGMRLAFDKPVVIIKDDKTEYSFDTQVIEHLTYPRDLRYNDILRFKSILAEKVSSTYETARTDKGHSSFLRHFGKFQVARIDEDSSSPEEIINVRLNEIQREISRVKSSIEKISNDAFIKTNWMFSPNQPPPSVGILSHSSPVGINEIENYFASRAKKGE